MLTLIVRGLRVKGVANIMVSLATELSGETYSRYILGPTAGLLSQGLPLNRDMFQALWKLKIALKVRWPLEYVHESVI